MNVENLLKNQCMNQEARFAYDKNHVLQPSSLFKTMRNEMTLISSSYCQLA